MREPALRHRPFCWCVLWFVVGTGVARGSEAAWLAALASSFLLILLAVPARLLRWPAVAALTLSAGVVFARGADLRMGVPDPLGMLVATPGSRPVVVQGVIEPDMRWQADGRRVRAGLRVEAVRVDDVWHPYTGRAWWSWYEPDRELASGTQVQVRGRLREARGFRNAGLFDYGRYLRGQGYHSQLSARGGDAVTVLGPGALPPLQSVVAWTRRHLASAVQHIPASTDGRGFLLAVLAGDRRWVGEDVRRVTETTGTYHLLSISGLHVGIVAGCVFLAARALRLRGWATTIFVVACLGAYAVVTGSAVPVVRATLMCSTALVLLRLRRAPDGLSILAFVAAAVVLADPLAFRSAGCQLSFGAVAGLLVAFRPTAEYLSEIVRHRVPRPFRWPALAAGHAVLVPLIVQVAIAPVLLWHFHRLPWVGVVANTVATPLLFVMLTAGALAALGLSVHPWIGALPAAVAAGAADGLLAWIRAVARLADAVPGVPAFPSVPVLLGYGAALALAWWVLRHRPVWRAGTVAAGLVLLTVSPGGPAPRGLEITALDVGNADATIIRFPDGRVMVVDGGARSRTFDAGKTIVVPALLRSGARRVDWLVATHGQNDHLGGLISVLDALPVHEIWTNGRAYDTWTARTFREQCAASGVPVRAVTRGHRISVGDVAQVRVLNPPSPRYVGGDNEENNNSVALRIDYAGVAVLLPADASHSLGEIVAAGAPWPDRVILKGPHHGFPRAGTAGAVAALRPVLAWASMGAVWPPRYPTEGVAGARSTWRTDWHGGLRIRIAPGGNITVTPTVGEPQEWPAPPEYAGYVAVAPEERT